MTCWSPVPKCLVTPRMPDGHGRSADGDVPVALRHRRCQDLPDGDSAWRSGRHPLTEIGPRTRCRYDQPRKTTAGSSTITRRMLSRLDRMQIRTTAPPVIGRSCQWV